ncbi:MAG TPA: FAD-dependent oxidoreductase [Chloroflexota bacterium]
MAKPVILAVDDEAEVLNAIARDLSRQYGEEYRVRRAGSARSALDLLKRLQLSGDPVALFVIDQKMPGMTGVEFLAEAIAQFPDAKRVLLTAYADTQVAIRAINEIRLDHYLLKPWDPPEEHLYPVLTDLLADWKAAFHPPFEGIRVIGHRWSAASHQVKDFLGRNQWPFRWLDVEENAEAQRLVELAGVEPAQLPLVVFPDSTHLAQPTIEQLAAKIGLATQALLPSYDLVIVGAGPAGLAAAVYGASEGLSTLLIEGEAPGGQAGSSSRIENYLGFPVGLSGGDLTRRAVAQAERFGAEFLRPRRVCAATVRDPYRFVRLTDGTEVGCRALLVATGVSYRRLDARGADRLTGSGVYYGAAITEALACQGQDVVVVGGANSAGQGAMYLSRFARTVTMLVRGSSLAHSMSQYLVAQIDSTPNISRRFHTHVEEVVGQTSLESIGIVNTVTGESETLAVFAMFVFIGAAPHTDWLAGVVERDAQGYILSGPHLLREGKPPIGWPLVRDPFWLETSVPGIFVAGDVRHRSVKRVASAVGEGAMAVQFIHQYLAGI